MKQLSDKIKSFPRKPGVYLFKDKAGDVIYVGKAKRLRDRVASYFRDEPARIASRAAYAAAGEARVAGGRPQLKFLLKRTGDIDFIVTDTEKEALLLENTLIKRHRPRYNVNLKDDKTYVSIRIGTEHPSPGISLTRRPTKDGASYFGPYDSSLAAREAVEQIVRYFLIRTCSDRTFANRIRPCLKYDIGRCSGPCAGKASAEEYARRVDEAVMFLSGRSAELLRILEGEMAEASEGMRYEEAGRFRDAIEMLRTVIEKQSVVRHAGGDHDAVGIARQGARAAICVLKVRKGALTGRRSFMAGDPASGDAKAVEEFLLQHYAESSEIPPKIFVHAMPEGARAVEGILSERRSGRVRISSPARGEMRRLVALARTNAREALALKARSRGAAEILERIGRALKLGNVPEAIECVDISNLSGREAVGSIVHFSCGEPDKSRYRIYNIQTLDTPDDYAMMHEVISRRFRADVSLRGADRERTPPDLMLVDGGKGQLAIAQRALAENGAGVPVAAIAKGEKKGHADRVFIPGRKNPINFRRGSKELLLLMRIRDEAHRFGVNAHRRKRSKAALGG
ncbi:MAG: excinuclease ABC subunit UvrC [Proteobacteria bacterium]|nr:excinuclease ABC subunit UvrC [Pseudomonadota bacterium]